MLQTGEKSGKGSGKKGQRGPGGSGGKTRDGSKDKDAPSKDEVKPRSDHFFIMSIIVIVIVIQCKYK